MNKSSLVVLMGFAVAGLLFIYGGEKSDTTDVVSSFTVSESNTVTVTEDPLANIEPAAGVDEMDMETDFSMEETTDMIDEEIVEDVEGVLAIEEDVTDMIEQGETVTTDTIEETVDAVEGATETVVDETIDAVEEITEEVEALDTPLSE